MAVHPYDPAAPLPDLLARLPEEIRRCVLDEAVRVQVPAGTVLFRPGDACSLYLLLTAGTVRVQLVTPDGHQLVLYRVEAGQTCVLTTSCLISHEAYAAEGQAETAVAGLGLTPATFERLLGRSADFRRMVFADFGHRLADLMLLLNEVAFRRIDARLADWLMQASRRESQTIRAHPPGGRRGTRHGPRGDQPAAQGVRAAGTAVAGAWPDRGDRSLRACGGSQHSATGRAPG